MVDVNYFSGSALLRKETENERCLEVLMSHAGVESRSIVRCWRRARHDLTSGIDCEGWVGWMMRLWVVCYVDKQDVAVNEACYRLSIAVATVSSISPACLSVEPVSCCSSSEWRA